MLKKKQLADSASDDFAADVLASLRADPPSISSKWLYDTQGSALFEKITRVEDYYLTRTEAAIFDEAFPALADMFGPGMAITEFGSGASIKTRRLLTALEPQLYVPIDVAEEFLQDAAEELHVLFPKLEIIPLVADLTAPYELPAAFTRKNRRLGFFPGSTIGNFPEEVAVQFLRGARAAMGDKAHLLISADLVKDKEVLERAYDDSEGVTRQFTLNLLTRMNRELSADFEISQFRHVSCFNTEQSRIEIFIESLTHQTVSIAGETFTFQQGERIQTEYSYKYTQESFAQLLSQSGWEVEQFWTDPNDWFGVFLASA
ncbi:MAG: L-histidine N(alpha)-methyltransferase [Aquisalinus sp.]|nr:L-histidine N(alpha)-methyltransferase [Aquisalinus sp.]